jgi:hypothetical protein
MGGWWTLFNVAQPRDYSEQVKTFEDVSIRSERIYLII